MANTLQLRRRIKTAQNVSKTTRAMQMIAASKLKRAQEATLSARPYVHKITSLVQTLSARVDEKTVHPYMRKNNAEKTLLLVFAPDKGLCGGLIANLTREYLKLDQSNYITVSLGKKLDKYIAMEGNNVLASFPFGTGLPTFDMVYPLSKIIDEYFLSGKVSRVQILATEFISVFAQKPQMSTLLPVAFIEEEGEKEQGFELFEPKAEVLLPDLLKHYLEMVLYLKLLESYLSEQGARMVSMQNATNNAKEVIEILTLEYNKARQEKITNEILDITSGSITYA